MSLENEYVVAQSCGPVRVPLPAGPGWPQGDVDPDADSTWSAQTMPITLLDLALLVIMLISGLLAMIRGFMREVLSIAAWVIAALVTLYGYSRLVPFAKTYFNNDIVANLIVIGGVFLVTLLVISVITVRISDLVLDSRVGALDRTLGFVFGLGRGLVIVVVAFLFFAWLVPDRSQPNWVRDAKSRVVLQSTGDWLMSMLPDDPESTILKRLKRPPAEGEPADAPPDARPGRGAMAPEEPRGNTAGYERTDRVGMRDLIETKTKQR